MVKKDFLLKKFWLKFILFFFVCGKFFKLRVEMWNILFVFFVLDVVINGVVI